MIEFNPPSFISDNDTDTIHQRMLSELPDDIDTMPGGFPWDLTRPAALEKAEMVQFQLVYTLMLMHPMWAWDEWLDHHATVAGVKRRAAGYASGYLMIEGVAGTEIPKGCSFATASVNNEPSLEYLAKEDYVIGEEEVIKIKIDAAEAGIKSNVPANSITLMSIPIKGITKVWNHEDISGGTEEEDDESLRERIQERNENAETSFVGNEHDYRSWARNVPGVGNVVVIPNWDGSGTVKLVVMDENGDPANDTILENVYEYIMQTKDPINRKAPIGAFLEVIGPVILEINYSGNIIFEDKYDVDDIIDEFKMRVKRYYDSAKSEGMLKYTKVCAILSETNGINDYTDFYINGETKNIKINQDGYPKTMQIDFKRV